MLAQQQQSGPPQHPPERPPSHPMLAHSATTPAPPALPETPAQQVLISAADRWGLLGLIAMVKSTDPDLSLLSVGTDLGTMGLDMNSQG